jgi:DNA-binding NtrC family response regulator
MTMEKRLTSEAAPIVLCVDDDPEMLASVGRILRREGYQLFSTTNPHEGLQILAEKPVAVLVSDFEMPEMTGVELCIGARNVRPETVRILLTGRGTFDTAVSGINDGEIFRFLSKPVDPSMLVRAVAGAVARNAELALAARDRDVSARRTHLIGELEAEYPGITTFERDEANAYRVSPDCWTRLSSAGLEHVRSLCDVDR